MQKALNSYWKKVILLNKVVSLIIVLFLVFSLVGMPIAAEKESKRGFFAGEIKSIDATKKIITLRNDEQGEFTCTIDEKTVVRMPRAGETMADLKVGDIASVVYENRNGKNIATTVTFLSLPVSSSKETTKPADSAGKQ